MLSFNTTRVSLLSDRTVTKTLEHHIKAMFDLQNETVFEHLAVILLELNIQVGKQSISEIYLL